MLHYTVIAGDTLRSIAEQFYGDETQWPRIHNANRDQIPNPDQIVPGQVLRIPLFFYTVVAGDTLRGLAQRFYGDETQWLVIFNANRDQLSNPDEIFPGPVLRIPSTDQYTIVAGDTLGFIAQRFYGNTNQWSRIFEANRDQVPSPDLIFVGQVLNIP
jgi:nucleoid-associated protein YgaU